MSGDDFTPDEALQEIGRVGRRVRSSSRGPGRAYLFVGLATMVYWPVIFLGGHPLPLLAGLGWIVLTVALCVYWARLRVHDRLMKRINGPVSAAYVVTMTLTFVVGVWLRPDRPTAGWTAALVALSVLAGLPLVFGGLRVVRNR
ncbi:cytochrome d ubiquinol oxidase subunit II [Microbispora sp. KK1-11]|uniref:cytochrome d ubiquinol oxidase subunit II n=1 Tax=Microbispora sp. KK1-11 TaxID=2053005 RepID=UPI00115BC10B|nr:cytochrome d ubiquinol oxidase subunit II [Microbispora sp. KK1-11]TQS29945.1 cytochrome d ubiquinol oxidase subunit II [Microbispora sp. KK1-11]